MASWGPGAEKSHCTHSKFSFVLGVASHTVAFISVFSAWDRSYSAAWRSQNVKESLAFNFGKETPLCLCMLYDRHAFVFAGDNTVA